MSAGGRRIPIPPGWAFVLSVMVVFLFVLPAMTKGEVTDGSVNNLFQIFAANAPIALALGLTMIAGEFDLSVIASYFLGGMLAVKFGGDSLAPAIAIGAAAGLLAGTVVGWLVTRFRISSIPVSLGVFILVWGATNLLGHNVDVPYVHYEVTAEVIEPVATYFTDQSLIVIGLFVVVGLFMAWSRFGRHLRAVGGDLRASRAAGVRVDRVLVATFALAGAIAAGGGALEGIASASAVPNAGFTALPLAVIAVVIGGVAAAGGKGSVLGIGAGVLAIAILETTLSIVGAKEELTSVITGTFLVVVAVVAAQGFRESRSVLGLQSMLRRMEGIAAPKPTNSTDAHADG
ncbi:MAG TPA: hypothetical protein VHA76_13525 [Solirubrobacterales bacterium]|nr:hypothetical protein [Solirubrobacterales bacterium]